MRFLAINDQYICRNRFCNSVTEKKNLGATGLEPAIHGALLCVVGSRLINATFFFFKFPLLEIVYSFQEQRHSEFFYSEIALIGVPDPTHVYSTFSHCL